MPIANALIAFGKWVAFLDANGNVLWEWFGDPLDKSMAGVQSGDRRKFLAEIFREIVTLSGQTPSGQSPPDGNGRVFSTGYKWEPFAFTNASVQGAVGITWNDETTDKLELGLGGQVTIPAAGQQVALGVLAQLLKIQNASPSHLLGNVKFTGAFPVPSFLTSGTLEGDIIASPFSAQVSLGATRPAIPNSSANTRQLTYNSAVPLNAEVLAWDAARMAMFVIQAWVRSKATPNGTDFFSRVDEHFFPMFGEPGGGVIGKFPLFQAQGETPDFKPWTNSVVNLDGGASGAMTFLWHLRALITGKEDTRFLNGSVYFPLHGNPIEGAVPNINNPSGQWPQDALQPGAWIGIENISNGFRLVVVVKADNKTASLPLGEITNLGPNPTVTLPDQTTVYPALSAMAVNAVNQALPSPLQITKEANNDITVTLFKETVAELPFPGQYVGKLRIVDATKNLKFIAQLPPGEIELPPPTDPKQIVAMVVNWVLGGVGATLNEPAKGLVNATATVIKSAIGGAVNPNEVITLITKIADAMGASATITISLTEGADLTLKFGTKCRAELAFRDLKFDEIPGAVVTIGAAVIHAEVEITTGKVTDIKFSLAEVKLAKPAGSDNTGLVATLLPDLTKAPGFTIALKGPPNNLLPEGGGKIPVQKTIGPLDLTALLVYISSQEMMLGIDLSFTLGPTLVSVFELGVAVNFKNGDVAPFLHGLAISLDADVVRLQGFFGEIDKGPGVPSDYVGGAVVSVVDMFELTAIGGYSQTAKGDASLFIFASLVAPLGGPPYLFITGIAGGFGFNRKLPPPGLLYDHPFLQVMAGKLDMSGSTEELLVRLSEYFAVTQDTYWLAGGIQFISFGFIYGKLVLAIQFGHSFAISILGMAAFGISPVAYFEIAIEVSADEEKFVLKAGLSPNSYIIHPDIFSLRGDFGLGVWYDGDFVFSIGGFHPLYNVPARYAALNLQRVAVKAVVWGWVRVSVECFFACTPQALMAGCSVSIAADFEGIAAGLDVYVDVLITWDPFYILARMGVTVWFEFLGRHEVSVELQIWTPPFGGIATIDLAIVSFDVAFGEDKKKPPPPKLAEFLTKQLGVPASGGHTASVQRFNTDEAAGLIRVEVTAGRIGGDDTKLSKSSKQEGLSTPIPVTPEFVFIVQTRLPLWNTKSNPATAGKLNFAGTTDLALCERLDREASFSVTADKIDKSVWTLLSDMFPEAEFGDISPNYQADDIGGKAAIGAIKTDTPSLPLHDSVEARYEPEITPASHKNKWLLGDFYEPPDPAERYPLPLTWVGNIAQPFRSPKGMVIVPNIAEGIAIKPRAMNVSRRVLAASMINKRQLRPIAVTSRAASFERTVVSTRLKGTTLATVPAGVPVMAPPPSPLRSAEMYGVTLRVAEPRTPAPVRRTPARPVLRPVAVTPRPAVKLVRPVISRRRIPVPPRASGNVLNLGPGGAGELNIAGDQLTRVFATNAGTQITRAIALSGANEPLADLYMAPNGNASFPRQTRRIVCIGEGTDAPVAPGPVPRPEENVGVETDSTLLVLGPREFAGKGCVVKLNTNMSRTPEEFDSIPGAEVLREASSVALYFPAPIVAAATAAAPGWSLVFTVEATVAEPGEAVDRIRWFSDNATFANLHTIIDAGRVAFIMKVQADDFWSVDIDTSNEWRLSRVILVRGESRDVATSFRSGGDWNRVDDSFEEQQPSVKSTVTLEVVR